MFVCLGFFFPLENFSLIWGRHHCRWRAANFELCLALMTVSVRFLSVQHLLWQGASVYNGPLWGPMTLTLIAERLAVELSLPVLFDLGLSRLGFEHPTFPLLGDRSSPLRGRHRSCKITSDVWINSYLYQWSMFRLNLTKEWVSAAAQILIIPPLCFLL